MIVKTLDNVETLFKGKARASELAQGKNAFIGLIELDEMAEVPIHRDSSEEYLYVLGFLDVDKCPTMVEGSKPVGIRIELHQQSLDTVLPL